MAFRHYVAAACAARALAAGAQAQQPGLQPLSDAIARYVAEQREISAVPGLSIVVTRGDTVLSAWGDGVDSDGAAMTGDTRAYIGSASKAFTGVAVMQLVEAGRIDLDAPVQAYLPEFTMADPRAAHIRVRDLLNQTSGMADIEFQEWGWSQPRTLEEAVARLSRTKLRFEPGTRFSYHNPNYNVAARLVEVVSGEDFADYLRAHIFRPLGMSDSHAVNIVHERADGAPRGHIHAFGHAVALPHPGFYIGGAGGVVTTADDLGKWLIAQANGGMGEGGARILSEDGMRLTHLPSAVWTYGFGWNWHEDGVISHSGGLASYSAYIAFSEGGDAVAVMAPAPFAGAEEIAHGVLDILQGRTPPERGPSVLGKIDFAVAAAILMTWALGLRATMRARTWAARMRGRPAWRAAGLAPQIILLAAILFGLPFLVSRVESWSWTWLFYYVPVWTVLFASVALTSLAVLAAKLFALSRRASPDRMAAPA